MPNVNNQLIDWEDLLKYKTKFDLYFDSLRNIYGDSILNKEGGDYSYYNKYMNFYLPRLYNSNFDNYYKHIL